LDKGNELTDSGNGRDSVNVIEKSLVIWSYTVFVVFHYWLLCRPRNDSPRLRRRRFEEERVNGLAREAVLRCPGVGLPGSWGAAGTSPSSWATSSSLSGKYWANSLIRISARGTVPSVSNRSRIMGSSSSFRRSPIRSSPPQLTPLSWRLLVGSAFASSGSGVPDRSAVRVPMGKSLE
jgi:hypothetical protein